MKMKILLTVFGIFSLFALTNSGGPSCSRRLETFSNLLASIQENLQSQITQCSDILSSIKTSRDDHYNSLTASQKRTFDSKPYDDEFNTKVEECTKFFKNSLSESCKRVGDEFEVDGDEILKLINGEDSPYSGIYPTLCLMKDLPKIKTLSVKAFSEFDNFVLNLEYAAIKKFAEETSGGAGPPCPTQSAAFNKYLTSFEQKLKNGVKKCDDDTKSLKQARDIEKGKGNSNIKHLHNQIKFNFHKCRSDFDDAIFEACVDIAALFKVDAEEILKLVRGEASPLSTIYPVSCFASRLPQVKVVCDRERGNYDIVEANHRE